jgi:hypothetical protein
MKVTGSGTPSTKRAAASSSAKKGVTPTREAGGYTAASGKRKDTFYTPWMEVPRSLDLCEPTWLDPAPDCYLECAIEDRGGKEVGTVVGLIKETLLSVVDEDGLPVDGSIPEHVLIYLMGASTKALRSSVLKLYPAELWVHLCGEPRSSWRNPRGQCAGGRRGKWGIHVKKIRKIVGTPEMSWFQKDGMGEHDRVQVPSDEEEAIETPAADPAPLESGGPGGGLPLL